MSLSRSHALCYCPLCQCAVVWIPVGTVRHENLLCPKPRWSCTLLEKHTQTILAQTAQWVLKIRIDFPGKFVSQYDWWSDFGTAFDPVCSSIQTRLLFLCNYFVLRKSFIMASASARSWESQAMKIKKFGIALDGNNTHTHRSYLHTRTHQRTLKCVFDGGGGGLGS